MAYLQTPKRLHPSAIAIVLHEVAHLPVPPRELSRYPPWMAAETARRHMPVVLDYIQILVSVEPTAATATTADAHMDSRKVTTMFKTSRSVQRISRSNTGCQPVAKRWRGICFSLYRQQSMLPSFLRCEYQVNP